MLLGLLFTQTPIGLADEEQSFKVRVLQDFYGTYEYPEAGSSSSEEGGEPTSPALLKRIKRPLKKMEQLWNSKEAIQGDSKQLPKTGEYRSKQFTIIGSFLLLIVLIIIVIKGEEEKNEKKTTLLTAGIILFEYTSRNKHSICCG